MGEKSLRRKTVSGMAWKLGERFCAKMVSLVVTIVLARLLLPEDYSVISIVSIFFTFCDVLITSGLNTALIQKIDADIEDYSTVLIFSLVVASLSYVVLFFAAPYIAIIYDRVVLIPIMRIMGINLFIYAYKSVVCAKISSELQFRKFFISTIIGTVISAAVGISMAYMGFGPWALMAQQMSNAIIDSTILTYTTRIKFVLKFSVDKFKTLFRYSWKLFAASIVTTIYDEIKPLVIGVKFSGTDLSYYDKGASLPKIVYSTMNDSLSAVLFPAFTKVQDDLNVVMSMTRRFMKTMSYIIYPMMIGFFVVAENLITVLLTEKWLPAAPYIRIFCLMYLMTLINSGSLQPIRAIGRSDIILTLEIIKKVIYLMIIVLFVFFAPTPEMLAVSGLLCSAVGVLVNTYPIKKLLGYKYRYQIIDLMENLIPSVVMGITVYAMNLMHLNVVALLFLQIIAGILVYFGLSILFKNKNFEYILDVARDMIKK